LLLRTLDHEVLPRAPWVPFAGVHAGSLKGYSAREILSDADKLVESLLEVNRLYLPDGQPVVFDLQIEAEALGCDLLWSDKAPPSVSSHPLLSSGSLPTRIPGPGEKRIALAIEATRRMKGAVGNRTALYGIVTGPLTLASHLRSTELFMDLILDPEYAARLIDYSFKVETALAGYYADAGADIIAVVDPLVSQISPAHFGEFLQKPYADFFSSIRARGLRSSFFVCGNATHNLEPMCKTRPDCISVDENVCMRDAKQITDRYKVCIGGNIQLTVAMLFGSQADNMKAVTDILDDCGKGGNLVVSPGCDMPYDVPVENAIAASLAAREPDKARVMLADYRRTDLPMNVELPDYSNLEKPLVEVFTLDSETCAACGYMMETAKGIKAQFGDRIELVEYKFTLLENIARCRKMGVKNLPAIYLNGVLAYSSIIPSRKDLAAKVESLL